MFIAEIGINHNGSLDIALDLIDVAVEAGADIVKFQKRNPDVCIPDTQKNIPRQTPWGQMSYLDYKKRIEFGGAEYDLIDAYCKRVGIKWTASVFDIDSLNFILNYNVPFLKIASSSITETELLEAVSESGKDVILSTGMSTESEINNAVSFFNIDKLTLMHCVSTYPTPDNETNINRVHTLRKLYPDVTLGYSGHEQSIYPSILAKSIGADIIERHITMSKSMWGTDQSNSIEPAELKELISALKLVPKWLGSGSIEMAKSEETAKLKLRR